VPMVTPMTLEYGDVPVSHQLAAILRDQIASGELAARTAIPSKRMLVQQYEVSPGTVERAIVILKAEGLIKTVIGLGLFVVPPEDRPRAAD
jgi:GntR family transcriptional regulator